jgi:hypothetical protein
VDTPGFSDTRLSDTEVLALIAKWMKDTYDEGCLLSGIVYLHRISDNRMNGPSFRNLQMMRKLCGSDSLQNVVLATTMWENTSQEDGSRREQQLKQEFWKDMIDGGATIARIETNTNFEGLNLVRNMLRNTPKATRLQQQLNDGVSLAQTDAGEEIRQEFVKLEAKLRKEIQDAKEDLKKAEQDRELANCYA